MKTYFKGILGVGLGVAVFVGVLPAWAGDAGLFITVRDVVRAPIGWVDFCHDHKSECFVTATAPRDIVLSPKAWRDLTRVNRQVNDRVKPMTDLEHYGVVEKWAYPDDGYGDCED